MRQRKYDYPYVIQQHYSQGWEDVTEENNPREARARVREYRENMPDYPTRMIRRRVLREAAHAPA